MDEKEVKAKKHDQAVLLSTIENDEYYDFLMLVLGLNEIDKDVLLCRLVTANFDKGDDRSFHQQVEWILRKHVITSSPITRRLLNAKRSQSEFEDQVMPREEVQNLPDFSSDDDLVPHSEQSKSRLAPPSPICDGQIYCMLCTKPFVSECFSARMQKADKDNKNVDKIDDLQMVYCLKHTSTSSFNDSYKEGSKPGVLYVNLASDEPAKDQYSHLSEHSSLQVIDFTQDDDKPVTFGRRDDKLLKKVLDEPIDPTEIECVHDYDGNGNLLIYGQPLKKFYEREGVKYTELYKTWYSKIRRYNEDKIRSESALRDVESSKLNEDEQRHALLHDIVMEQYKKDNPDYIESSSDDDSQEEDVFKLPSPSKKPRKIIIIDDSDDDIDVTPQSSFAKKESSFVVDDIDEDLLPSGYRNKKEEECDKKFQSSFVVDDIVEDLLPSGYRNKKEEERDKKFQSSFVVDDIVEDLLPSGYRNKKEEECDKVFTDSLHEESMKHAQKLGKFDDKLWESLYFEEVNRLVPFTKEELAEECKKNSIPIPRCYADQPARRIMRAWNAEIGTCKSYTEHKKASVQNVFAIDNLPAPTTRRSPRIAKVSDLPAEPPKETVSETIPVIYSRGLYSRNTNVLKQK
jgi:hypothetical protein